MKKIFTVLLILTLGVANFGCSSSDVQKESATSPKNEELSVSNDAAQNNTNSDNNSNNSQETNKENSKKINESISDNNLLSDDKIATYKKLFQDGFMKEHYPIDNGNIVFEKFGDFNNKGKAIGIFGIKSNSGDSDNLSPVDIIVYVNFDEEGNYEVVDILQCFDLFPRVVEYNISSITGEDEKFLHISYQTAAQSRGFNLYKLTDKGFEEYMFRKPYADVGMIDLFDENNDGIYDGYYKDRFGYDVYYHNISEKIIFAGEGHTNHGGGSLEISYEYPQTPENVALEYAYLSNIRDEIRNPVGEIVKIDGLDEMLDKLSKNGFVSGYEYIWDSHLLQNTALGVVPYIEFNAQINGDKAVVHSEIIGMEDMSDNIGLLNLIDYKMKKINGKWVIDSQNIIPLYENENISGENTALYLSHVMSNLKYDMEYDDGNIYDKSIILEEEVLFQNNAELITHIYSHKEDKNKFPSGRTPNWYFVEFIGKNDADKPVGNLYLMTKSGFDEFMKTGHIVDNADAILMASNPTDKNATYIAHGIENKLFNLSISIQNEDEFLVDVLYYLSEPENRQKSFMKAYKQWCEKNPEYSDLEKGVYHENFVWKKNKGLISYFSWFENGKYMDTISNISLIMVESVEP